MIELPQSISKFDKMDAVVVAYFGIMAVLLAIVEQYPQAAVGVIIPSAWLGIRYLIMRDDNDVTRLHACDSCGYRPWAHEIEEQDHIECPSCGTQVSEMYPEEATGG